MLWRWLSTGTAALLGFAGAALLDCTYPFLEFVDIFELCVEADLSLPGGAVALAAVLLTAGVALVGFTWVPHAVDLRRERDGIELTGEALVKNVHRLPEEASGPVERLLPQQGEEVSVDLRRSDTTDAEPSESRASRGPV